MTGVLRSVGSGRTYDDKILKLEKRVKELER